MQTMDPRKESVENENDENGKKAWTFFLWSASRESDGGDLVLECL